MLGAISSVGVVNVSMREPGNVKRRKVAGVTKRKAPSDKISMPKGTTGAHYMHFIIDTMDIMDTVVFHQVSYLIAFYNQSIDYTIHLRQKNLKSDPGNTIITLLYLFKIYKK